MLYVASMKTLFKKKKASDSRLTQTKAKVLLLAHKALQDRAGPTSFPPTLTSATTHPARSGLRTALSGMFSPRCHAPSHFIRLSVYISRSGVSPRVTAPKRGQPSTPAPLPPGLAFFFLPVPVFSWPIIYFRFPPASTRTRLHEGGQGLVSLGHSSPPEPRTVPDPQDILSNVCRCTTGKPSKWCL